jgi:hypothetical protein
MKRLFVLFIMLFAVSFGFAQEAQDIISVENAEDLTVTFEGLKAFFLPFISGQIIILLAEAKKHLAGPNLDWGVFVSTNIMPFAITLGGGVALYFALAHMPFLTPFIETFAGEELSPISAITLGAAANGIFKGITRKTVTEEAI